jgi:hypothetical protein
MAKRSPAEQRAREAVADAVDAAKAARRTAKRVGGKPARRLRLLADETVVSVGRLDAAGHPDRAARTAREAASRLRLATDAALRAHTAKQRERAAETQERVRAAMAASAPVVATVPPARVAGLPALVRPEAARRRQTFGSWVSMATIPEPGWSADRWATENPPVSSDDALPR